MPLVQDVGGLFTREWERFKDGARQLTGDEWRAYQLARGRTGPRPDEPTSVNIPGWNDILRTGPRYRATPEEVQEYYNARRARREPSISPEARRSIESYRDFQQRVRTSAQPEYSQAWGQILTAIDNVQDFVSTLSTFGRLSLWAAPRLAGIAEALSLGTLRGALGAGARIGGRFVPILGWGILAGDILNLLGLTGMLASPLYAMLCSGPRAAFAAGAPTLLAKRALKTEVWNAARRNPFGRTARLAARSKAVGKLPGIGNLIEVAQTTEQLFGYGLSLGGVVGAITETGAVLGGATGEAPIAVRGGWGITELGRLAGTRARNQGAVERELFGTAGRVMLHAPSIAATQDTFSTDEHLDALIAIAAAGPLVMRGLPPVWDHPDFLRLLELELEVRPQLFPETRALLAAEGLDVQDGARWPLPGAPRVVTVADLVEHRAGAIAQATRRFIERRRDTAEGVFAAALVAQATEALWYGLTGNPDALRFRLAPDYQLLAGLAEDGYLLNAADPPGALWRFWTAARGAVEAQDGRYPGLPLLKALAETHRIGLIKMLPPDAPWPPEWEGEYPELTEDPPPAVVEAFPDVAGEPAPPSTPAPAPPATPRDPFEGFARPTGQRPPGF